MKRRYACWPRRPGRGPGGRASAVRLLRGGWGSADSLPGDLGGRTRLFEESGLAAKGGRGESLFPRPESSPCRRPRTFALLADAPAGGTGELGVSENPSRMPGHRGNPMSMSGLGAPPVSWGPTLGVGGELRSSSRRQAPLKRVSVRWLPASPRLRRSGAAGSRSSRGRSALGPDGPRRRTWRGSDGSSCSKASAIPRGGPEVASFPGPLATAGKVSASTQNQARSALGFQYLEVLHRDLGKVAGLVQARRPPARRCKARATKVCLVPGRPPLVTGSSVSLNIHPRLPRIDEMECSLPCAVQDRQSCTVSAIRQFNPILARHN